LSGILATCAAAASIAAVAQAAKEPVQAGVFALFGGTATTTAEARIAPANSGGGLNARVRFLQTDGKTPILAFAVSGERTLQATLVRDDLATFTHLKSSVDATTGTFHIPLTGLDAAHRYYLYADTIPQSGSQQVFRFNVQDQNIAAVPPAATLAASPKSVPAGPYAVSLGDTTIVANMASKLLIAVKEHGKAAWDLQQYQGGPAFATMINTSTLEYIHVKPVIRGSSGASARSDQMGGTPQAGPYMQADLPALPTGSYKLWLQLRGNNGKTSTAAFTIVAQ
jgi:hypothetical protein